MTTPAPPIADEAFELAARCLRVLAHADRLRIVDLLSQRRMTVGELADELGRAPAAVSQHLNHMRAHRLLDAQRDGRAVYYRVTNPHATNVIRCIRRHGPGTD